MIELNLSVLESNDSKTLVFTDTTGISTNGWGDSGNIDVTDIDGITHTLELQLTFKTNAETVVYDTIDLYSDVDFGGPWTTVADLVFAITADKLMVNGVSEFTIEDMIPDGIMDVTYTVDAGLGTEDIFTMTVLVYNQIRNKVYDRLRQIPKIYASYDFRGKEISDTTLMYSLVKSMEAGAYIALEEELLNTLDTVEKLYTNGSNYTWQ